MKFRLKRLLQKLSLTSLFIFLVMPASTNYQLKSYEFGGGGGTSDSTNYSVEGILGEGGGEQKSANYSSLQGLIFAQTANVPTVTLANSSNWYNKLLVTIGSQNNPSDALYAIAISDDNWVTTEYVQNDNTVGSTLGTEDYQTYTNWGEASGENIIGLTPNTTYKVKVKATSGRFTESPYGPEASASTVNPSIDFDIDVSSSDTETAAPYAIAFGNLSTGSVNTATDKVWIDIATNGEAGGYVYITDSNAGLKSAALNYTISAVSGDLSSLSEGFGAQSATDTETSGGPLTPLSPYNGLSQNVGIISTTTREIYSTSGAPIVGGRGSFILKAKPSATTPASTDYTDTLTVIASGTF